jgi:hypothetical protein
MLQYFTITIFLFPMWSDMSKEGLTLSVEHAVGTGMVTYNKFFHTCGAAAPACE